MIQAILSRIRDSVEYCQLVSQLRDKKNISVKGASGSFQSLLLHLLYNDLVKTTLVIVPSDEVLEELADDIAKAELAAQTSNRVFTYPEVQYSEYFEDERDKALRQACVEQLSLRRPILVLATIRSLLEKISEPAAIREYCIELRTGVQFGFDYLVELLQDMGFERLNIVDRVGVFAVRGGIVDLYPYTEPNPIRIEFFGEEIESIRAFDIYSQRSVNELSQVAIYPKISGAGEHLEEHPESTLFDYLDDDSLVIELEPELVRSKAALYLEELSETAHSEIEGSASPRMDGYLDLTSYETQIQKKMQLQICGLSTGNFAKHIFEVKGIESFQGNLQLIQKRLRKNRGTFQNYVLCSTHGQMERVDELLENDELEPQVDFKTGLGELQYGFYFQAAGLAVYPEHQIFGRVKLRSRPRQFKSSSAIRFIKELKPGDYVVHIDYGIATYAGLEKIKHGNHTEEALKLVYAKGDKLFVPIEHFSRVQKFSSEEGAKPKINTLGTPDWERIKGRTKKAITDMAADLIKLYAERQSRKGFAFKQDTYLQHALEANFPFEETADQAKAIADVKGDMETPIPMDRLVCGDVGYGKTEVALRAAFKALDNNKQTAILVPTTILAQQHYETLSERFRSFPVSVNVLSRFKGPEEQKQILADLSTGKLDVVVGTHRLLSKDVAFKDLGLLVIDEEQRFGVGHKEKLRKLSANVDTLTLTATPIPRTLHFSLMGARDLSLISTAPKDRLPILTEITTFDEKTIRTAIRRELGRKGQVYYVHNRVKSIDQVVETLKMLVPEASYAVIHGQMPPAKIDKIIHSFLRKEFDVLVATTIIENGIDIPNVNTIFIDRAHQYGLAQLYQLRGRVGRSNNQAFCYLLTLPFGRMSHEAVKRLQAIEEHTELGAGFLIAMQDLEIRGAGNVFGAEQSGFINAIGFDFYCKILEETIAELKQAASPTSTEVSELAYELDPTEVKVSISLDTYLPETYVNVPAERIKIYKQLSELKDLDKLDSVRQEMADRFGRMPAEVTNLLSVVELKYHSAKMGMEKIEFLPNWIAVSLAKELTSSEVLRDQFKVHVNALLSAWQNVKMAQSGNDFRVLVGFPFFDVNKRKQLSAQPLEAHERLTWFLNLVADMVKAVRPLEQEMKSGAPVLTT